ncbi:hypothetical protein ACGV4K_24575 [Streptomyces sp. WAC8370]|uniref:hypothetical protein n=1 Tax=Streptomyces sp. WAC8370 TaxID=3351348 RepID=UPI003F7B21C8
MLAQAAVLGLDLGGAGLAFAHGAVGGIEAELAAADLLGEVRVVLEDRGRAGEAGQADAVDLGLVAQGVFRKGTGHRDDHRLLALADVPAAQAVGEDQPLGVAAGVGGEARLDVGNLAGGQTVTPVEEDTVGAQDDGRVLALGLDGLGQVVQLVGAEHREHVGGGVGLDVCSSSDGVPVTRRRCPAAS